MLSALYSKSMATIGRRVPEKLQPLWKHEAGEFENKIFKFKKILAQSF
jgi:hypothetical protein